MNKKHKSLRKVAPGMEFKDYAKRINSVKEIETFGQLPKEKQKQGRFSLKNDEMVLEGIVNLHFHKLTIKPIISVMVLCHYTFHILF